MEALVREEGRKVINDWETADDTYSGLIFLMYWLEDDRILPLFVGKAGKYGRDGESLSANLQGLRGSSTGKFARWGDGHDYHIGDLSAVIFDHEKHQPARYKQWADRLFNESRQLKQQTYFWTKALRYDDIGLYHRTGFEVEDLKSELIELAAETYPDYLLNRMGT